MTAIKMEELERLEKEHGLEPDGLTYQLRCSRIAAIIKGEEWVKPEKKKSQEEPASPKTMDIKSSSLYGTRVIITPMMIPDAKRNLAYDEVLGDELVVRDFNAGEALYDQAESVQRMVGDYEIIRKDPTHKVIAKTTFPKIGTEISITIGKDLCPVVRGNDGKKGYIWNFPTKFIQVDDTVIKVFGLKTLIQQIYPELLPKFSNKPMMDYIDGITLAASIPMTEALLKEHRRKELLNARAGLS